MERQVVEQRVKIRVGPNLFLDGNLSLPFIAHGVVLFAHGSGSSRHSPRNQYVARTLNSAGFATLLIDLLTYDEEIIDMQTRHLRFDVELLGNRLMNAIDWLTRQTDTRPLNIGLFGASTGAAAALIAAAYRPSLVSAIVSRGGRPDLASAYVSDVRAPTLLIVGGKDEAVIQLNRRAMARLRTPNELEIVPQASHLFTEPNKLETVAALAENWFVRYLSSVGV
jgi:putative phosphoribosyl transferase